MTDTKSGLETIGNSPDLVTALNQLFIEILKYYASRNVYETGGFPYQINKTSKHIQQFADNQLKKKGVMYSTAPYQITFGERNQIKLIAKENSEQTIELLMIIYSSWISLVKDNYSLELTESEQVALQYPITEFSSQHREWFYSQPGAESQRMPGMLNEYSEMIFYALSLVMYSTNNPEDFFSYLKSATKRNIKVEETSYSPMQILCYAFSGMHRKMQEHAIAPQIFQSMEHDTKSFEIHPSILKLYDFINSKSPGLEFIETDAFNCLADEMIKRCVENWEKKEQSTN